MSYKVQITVDEQLNKTLKASAKAMGLSVNFYARLALMRVVFDENNNLIFIRTGFSPLSIELTL